MAQAFDLATLRVTGSAMPLAEDLLYFRDLGQADFSVSTNGVLAYQAGNTQSRLVWFRRNGSEETQVGEPGDYGFTALSADETLVATDVMDRRAGTTDIQVFDLARGGKPSSVTLDPTMDLTPVFSPDRQQIAFASARGGAPHVHVKRLNDSSPAESARLTFCRPCSSFPIGTRVPADRSSSFRIVSPGTGLDAGSGSALGRPQTGAARADGRGRHRRARLAEWPLAGLCLDRTGRSEVYVRALTGGTGRSRISTDGGVSPRWRGDGRELFYIATGLRFPSAPPCPTGD